MGFLSVTAQMGDKSAEWHGLGYFQVTMKEIMGFPS